MKKLLLIALVLFTTLSMTNCTINVDEDEEADCECQAELIQGSGKVANYVESDNGMASRGATTDESECWEESDACNEEMIADGYHLYVKKYNNPGEKWRWFKKGKGGTDEDPTSNKWTDMTAQNGCDTLALPDLPGAIRRWNNSFGSGTYWADGWSYDGKKITIGQNNYIIRCYELN